MEQFHVGKTHRGEAEYRAVWMTYFVDHVESTLKHSVEDLRDLTRDVSPQLVDDGRHGAEDLGLSGGGDVALVVNQDRVEKRRHEVLPYLEWIGDMVNYSRWTPQHRLTSDRRKLFCFFIEVLHIIRYSKPPFMK